MSATKNDQGKSDLSIIPKSGLEAVAKAFEVGGLKYGRHNFRSPGLTVQRIMSALLRHAYSYNEGEENDLEDGQPHLGSVIACAMMIIEKQRLGTIEDDRPNQQNN